MESALGARIVRRSRLSGGDIHEAWSLLLDDGREVFAKTNERAPPDMFAAEAHGLEWLRAGPLRVPRVLAVGERFLVLEKIARGAPARDASERMGRGLAELHRIGAPTFGLDRGNYLATIAQDNRACADWPTFYAERRLVPLVRAARARVKLSARIDRVIERLSELCGPAEPPARLHGDLWGGNHLHDERGAPVIFDPAAYGGHREIDLAMMRLFGGFDDRVFAAYDEAYPLAAGHEQRVPLYQLLPLLAHCVLFGGSYAASVERAVDDLI